MAEATTEQWRNQVLDEHRHLREMLADLEEFLEQARPEVGKTGFHTWAAQLSRKLVRLHDELFRHFRFEEQSGMVEEVSVSHPRASGKIQAVVDEHPKMLAELRDLMSATLAYSEGRPESETRLRQRVHKLIDTLARHERAETDLIQRLEYRDLGAQD